MTLKPLFAAGALAAAALFGASTPAYAQYSGDVIRIGIITDMSSVYADIDGQGGIEAIRMAIQDAGGSINGKKVEVISADHQNKPDVAASKAREWIDSQNLALLIGGTSSGTNLAMAGVAKEKKRPFISIGAGLAVDVGVHAGHVGDEADADHVARHLGHGGHRCAEQAGCGEGACGEDFLEFHGVS
jgi:branched-chain amino acid transport system substrate-binding protein